MRIFSGKAVRGVAARDAIIGHVRESNNYSPDEDLADALAFEILKRSSEQVWLVATKYRVYRITDDTKDAAPRIDWSISKSRIVSEGELVIDIEARERSSEEGLIDIGYRKNNPYTLDLFTETEGGIRDKVLSLLREKML